MGLIFVMRVFMVIEYGGIHRLSFVFIFIIIVFFIFSKRWKTLIQLGFTSFIENTIACIPLYIYYIY